MVGVEPFDIIDSNNPWLINRLQDVIEIGSNKLTAEYIWSKNKKERVELLDKVFCHYRKNGFPKFKMANFEMNASFSKLIKKKVSVENSKIINYNSSLCLNVIRHFLNDLYFKAKGPANSRSCYEVFNDDLLLKKVLKNRMGWNSSVEDGEERPYVFSIGDKMLIQGMRSSGLAYNVSQFKPVVAKTIYHKYAKCRILDYSAGWGARALAAISLGIEYVGIDPLTCDSVREMVRHFNGNGYMINGCSEDANLYVNMGKFDFIFSCPPYFDKECYEDSKSQCYIKYDNYDEWLKNYWYNTVKNCKSVLLDDGLFGIVMINKKDKYNIFDDMVNVIYDVGFELHETIDFTTVSSHLSGKVKTKKNTKNNESLMTFKRTNK